MELSYFTLTLALSHQGRGDSVGCVVLLLPVSPCRPVDSRLRGNDGRFCKGLIKGEGIPSVVLSCSPASHPALWILP